MKTAAGGSSTREIRWGESIVSSLFFNLWANSNLEILDVLKRNVYFCVEERGKGIEEGLEGEWKIATVLIWKRMSFSGKYQLVEYLHKNSTY